MIFKLLILSFFGLFNTQEEYDLGCSIVQKSEVIDLREEHTTMSLDRKKFSFRFNSRKYDIDKGDKYATQIAISKDKKDLELIKEGQRSSNVYFYSPGTGIAASGAYTCFYPTNHGGHQYIIYEEEGEQRAKLIRQDDDILRLEATVKCIVDDGDKIKMKKSDYDELHFIIFNDDNLNGVFDKGEFKTVTVTFE